MFLSHGKKTKVYIKAIIKVKVGKLRGKQEPKPALALGYLQISRDFKFLMTGDKTHRSPKLEIQ